MRATVLHSPGDIRLDEVDDPRIEEPTDAIVRTVAACVCGSDLWPYRGINEQDGPSQIGHEFIGVVDEVGSAVTGLSVGDFVIGPFLYSDNTCAICAKGMTAGCLNGGGYVGCQAERIRVPQADGTLVIVPGEDVTPNLHADLLALSDVFPTGHHAAVSAGVTEGSTVVVVGDGAVGLCAVLAAKRLGAATVIAMSRHASRQEIATEFGADHLVEERGKEGAARVKELLGGIGADAVLECVGTQESMKQAFQSLRPGGTVGYVGLPHDVELNVPLMFFTNRNLVGGVAPVRAYLDELLPEVLDGRLRPGRVFDLELGLDEVDEAYRAMDERRAIKALLRP